VRSRRIGAAPQQRWPAGRYQIDKLADKSGLSGGGGRQRLLLPRQAHRQPIGARAADRSGESVATIGATAPNCRRPAAKCAVCRRKWLAVVA